MSLSNLPAFLDFNGTFSSCKINSYLSLFITSKLKMIFKRRISISIYIRFKIADIRSFMVFLFGFPVDGSIWYVFSNFRILFKLFKRLLPFVIELRLVDAGFWPFSWSFCDAGLWGMKRRILRAEMRRFEVFYQVRSLLICCLPQLRPKNYKIG